MTEYVAPRVIEIVARTFGVDPDELDYETTAYDVDGWDSLAHATLIIRLEKNFNVMLDPRMASEAQNLGSLIKLIEAML